MNGIVRITAWILALALVVLPVVAVLNGWFASDRWPIERLRLTAEFERVSAEQVKTAVDSHLGRGFFAIELDEVRSTVMSLPWVERVEVRKRWPDLIEITVHEHRAFARWGKDRLLSDHGELFTAPGIESLQGLPALAGPEARVADVVALYRQAQATLSGTGLAVSGARLSPRGSWTLTLGNGARVVIGRADPEPRLQRLVRFLPTILSGETRQFERIDLRYTNGFAVRWVEEPGIGNEESKIVDERLPASAASQTTNSLIDRFWNPMRALPNLQSPISNPGSNA
jgi:cell division protein FtsQ